MCETTNYRNVITEPEYPDGDYVPAEEAAYVRKLLKEAKMNDMTNTLPYSREDIEELFRAKLKGYRDNVDDGMLAACVFVDCITQYLVDVNNGGSFGGKFADDLMPDPDINENIKVVSYLLRRYTDDTSGVADIYRTVHQLLDIFFHNFPCAEAEAARLFPGAPEMFQSRLMRVYALLSELWGQEHTPEKFWNTALLLHRNAHDIVTEAFGFGLITPVVTVIVFHVLLSDYYLKRGSNTYKTELAKCALFGVRPGYMLSRDMKKALDIPGFDVSENIEKLYFSVSKRISALNAERCLGTGLFDRLGLLFYIEMTALF